MHQATAQNPPSLFAVGLDASGDGADRLLPRLPPYLGKAEAAQPMGSEKSRRGAWLGGGTLGVAVVSRWRMWPRGPGRKEPLTGAGTVSFPQGLRGAGLAGQEGRLWP